MPVPLPSGADSKDNHGTQSRNPTIKPLLTHLKQWSCDDQLLPDAQSVKAIHVYDFDNTLFCTPLPNKHIWTGKTAGQLGNPDIFIGGGWWHDSRILAATGEGIEREEPIAWEGWWNENIVSLVQLSTEQPDVLTILLTGRSEDKFSDLIKRITRSKKLNFDMLCLRPRSGPSNQSFSSTMVYKQAVIKDLILAYKDAEEIRIYEDRPQHVKAFKSFLTSLNKTMLESDDSSERRTISFDVLQVAENATTLDPTTEIAEVQRILNEHNLLVREGKALPGVKPLRIRRSILYTGHLVPADVSKKLHGLVRLPPQYPSDEIKYLANNITSSLKSQRSVNDGNIAQSGTFGKTIKWRIKSIGQFEDMVWAASVEPISESMSGETEAGTSQLILAIRRGVRPNEVNRIKDWETLPYSKQIEFETMMGEKAVLQIEEEQAEDTNSEGSINRRHVKKPYKKDTRHAPGNSSPNRHGFRYVQSRQRNYSAERYRPHHDHRNITSRASHGSRGRGEFRGDRSMRGLPKGVGYRGRGGGPSQYRSLDDVRDKYSNAGYSGRQAAGRDKDAGLPYNAY